MAKSIAFGFCLYFSSFSLLSQDIAFKSGEKSGSLIELYSSEGCNSCPPAEEWLNQLKSAPGLWKTIFPVAFHVDYWDGLGWPDRFAKADYTQRQRDYAVRLGQGSVYTPEFILNGLEWHRSWLGGQDIPALGGERSGRLAVSVGANKITAFYTPGATVVTSGLSINVALLGFNLVTDVQRGENGGRTLRHDFVALGFASQPISADEKGVYNVKPIDRKSSTSDVPGALVAWVSKADGSILQIAGGWLPAASR